MKPLSDTEVKKHVEAIARDGFSVMPGAIETDMLQEIRVELERLEKVRPGGDIPPAPESCVQYHVGPVGFHRGSGSHQSSTWQQQLERRSRHNCVL